MPKAQAIPRPWSRPATQLAEIMAKVALELEARSDQGPSGDLNRGSIQEACRAQRDATVVGGRGQNDRGAFPNFRSLTFFASLCFSARQHAFFSFRSSQPIRPS